MRLAGFTVKKATYAVGIRPWGGCEQRAAALNGWMTTGVKFDLDSTDPGGDLRRCRIV